MSSAVSTVQVYEQYSEGEDTVKRRTVHDECVPVSSDSSPGNKGPEMLDLNFEAFEDSPRLATTEKKDVAEDVAFEILSVNEFTIDKKVDDESRYRQTVKNVKQKCISLVVRPLLDLQESNVSNALLDFTNADDGEETKHVTVQRGKLRYDLWAYMSVTIPTRKVDTLWGRGKSLEGAILIIPRHVRSTYEVKGRTSTKPMLFIKPSDIRSWATNSEQDDVSDRGDDLTELSKDFSSLIQLALPQIFVNAQSKISTFYNAERITGFKRSRDASNSGESSSQKQIFIETNQSHRKKK